MEIRKVYDELYGMIEDLKKKIAALSGGDEVTIMPALDSGTKIADYAIGETEGSLFAPTSPAYSATEFDTGKTWIDGRPVYGIVVTDTIDAAATSKVIHTDTNIDEVLFMVATIKGDTWELPLPFADTNYVNFKKTDGTLLRTQASSFVSDYPDCIVYMEYVKTPPSPEPENNTKKRRTK